MNWIKKILNVTSKKKLVQSLEQTYNRLKAKNLDKDEHWLLANTWLTRYRNTNEAKEKGSKLVKYIAYKDTFQFSLLDTPKSIRALILFVIYKESEEKITQKDSEEFEQIMNFLQKFRENGTLIDEYKQRNPFTWNEIQTEKDESTYGLYGYLRAVDHLNKNPEEMERAMREIEDLDAGRMPKYDPHDMELNLSKEKIEEIKKSIDENI